MDIRMDTNGHVQVNEFSWIYQSHLLIQYHECCVCVFNIFRETSKQESKIFS